MVTAAIHHRAIARNAARTVVARLTADGQLDAPKVTQYVYSPRYIDAPVARYQDLNGDGDTTDQGDSVLLYTADANFNVTGLINAATGAVVERYAYNPYGKVTYYDGNWTELTNLASAFNNTVLYTGRTLDTETGLFYYRARYYDVNLMRFLGRDPVYSTPNLYAYCWNHPVLYVDPNGLRAVGVFSIRLTSQYDDGTEENRWQSDNMLSWVPPRNERGEATCPCQHVRLFQMVRTHMGRNGPWPYNSSDNGWHDDTKALIPNGCLTDWNSDASEPVQPENGVVGQSTLEARIHDTPGQEHPSWFQYYLTKDFRVAAVCIDEDSNDFGEVYGNFRYGESIYELSTQRSQIYNGAKYLKRYYAQGAAVEVDPGHWLGEVAKDAPSNSTGVQDVLQWRAPGGRPDSTMLDEITKWITKNYPDSNVKAHW